MVALADLQPASFRGVRFLVPRDNVEEGPNLVLHRYPDSSVTYAEYNGRQSPEFHITAVLHGPGCLSQFAALRAALNADIPGTLQHPWYGAKFCAVKGPWKATRQDADSGVIELDICFVETAPPIFPGIVTAIAALVTGLSSSFMQTAFTMFASVYGNPLLTSTSVEVISESIQAVASPLLTALGAAHDVSLAAGHLIDQPEYHAQYGTPFGAELTTLFRGPFEDTTYPGEAIVRGLKPVDVAFDEIEATADAIVATTLDYAVRRDSLLTFATFGRLAVVAALAEAMAGTTYTSAEQIIDAKSLLLATYAKVRVDGVPSEIGQQLSEIVNKAIEVLQSEELQLPRIVTIKMQPSMPASVLGYMLYDDESRTDMLVQLNPTANPLLLERSANALTVT